VGPSARGVHEFIAADRVAGLERIVVALDAADHAAGFARNCAKTPDVWRVDIPCHHDTFDDAFVKPASQKKQNGRLFDEAA
jgi:hypothetical protein